jgi:hypothetical protein
MLIEVTHYHQTVPDIYNPRTGKSLLMNYDMPERSTLTDLCTVYSWNKMAITRDFY